MRNKNMRDMLVHVYSGRGNVEKSEVSVTDNLMKAYPLGLKMMDAHMGRLEHGENMVMEVIDAKSGNTMLRDHRTLK